MMNEALFHDLLKRQKDSGLTVRDFCANEGINPSSFYYWLKKCKAKDAQPKAFIPLVIDGSQLSTQKKKMHSPTALTGPDAPVLLELTFPNGTSLKVRNQVDLPLLQALVHLYD